DREVRETPQTRRPGSGTPQSAIGSGYGDPPSRDAHRRLGARAVGPKLRLCGKVILEEHPGGPYADVALAPRPVPLADEWVEIGAHEIENGRFGQLELAQAPNLDRLRHSRVEPDFLSLLVLHWVGADAAVSRERVDFVPGFAALKVQRGGEVIPKLDS